MASSSHPKTSVLVLVQACVSSHRQCCGMQCSGCSSQRSIPLPTHDGKARTTVGPTMFSRFAERHFIQRTSTERFPAVDSARAQPGGQSRLGRWQVTGGGRVKPARKEKGPAHLHTQLLGGGASAQTHTVGSERSRGIDRSLNASILMLPSLCPKLRL